MSSLPSSVFDEALELLRILLRIDTTNPPGNERPAAEALAAFFQREGIEPILLEGAPQRTNIIARLKGDASMGGPLMLSAHLDVVPADASRWRHPPFAGVVQDGFIWGRGAIDMKHMAAMSALVLAQLKRSGRKLGRDVIFSGVADEEQGCALGSRFLVEQHADLVRAEFALGELGGFPLYLPRKRFYLIQTAERGICWLRLRVRGTQGHGSVPREDNAVVRLGAALARLGRTRLPQHHVPEVEAFVNRLAEGQPGPQALVLRQLLRPALASSVLRLLPERAFARTLDALLRNTVSPTVLRGSSKINVIPAVAEADVDGRLLPGQTVDGFLREVRAVIGPEVEIEVLSHSNATVTTPVESDVTRAIEQALAVADPGAEWLPYVIPGFTDANSWSRLGTRCYGFSPVRFGPEDPRFSELYHADDERIPVEGFRFGLNLLFDVVSRLTQPA